MGANVGSRASQTKCPWFNVEFLTKIAPLLHANLMSNMTVMLFFIISAVKERMH